MKKRTIGFILGSLLLAACGSTNTTTTSSNEPTSIPTTPSVSETTPNISETTPNVSETTPTPSLSTPTPSTTIPTPTTPEPVELTMTLLVSKEKEANGTYKLKIGEEMTVTPKFSIEGHEEEVTYKATETGLFGTSPSYNITINNGVIKAVGKASKITLTVTSSVNEFVQSIIISTYAELDEHDESIKAKLDTALNIEEEMCSNIYFTNETNSTREEFIVSVLESGVEYDQTTIDVTGKTEYYAYSGMYGDEYHSYKRNLKNNNVTITSKDTAPSYLNLFVIKVSSMNSYNGVSAVAKYYYTTYFANEGYNNAKTVLTDNGYNITSNYVKVGLADSTYISMKLVLNFLDNKLSSLLFERFEYDSTGYNFETNEVIGKPINKIAVSATLTYETRKEQSERYNPQDFYFTSYDIILTDEKGNVGTTFQAGSKLSYSYGDVFAPSTALKDFDKLNFVSSSDEKVIKLNQEGKLECLASGSTTLKFISNGGVEKEVLVSVEGEVVRLTDAEIKQILESKEWQNTSVDISTGETKVKATLSFVDGKGTFTFTSTGVSMTFDYEVINGELIATNFSSSDSKYSIVKVSFNEGIDVITVKYSELTLFGTTFSYDYNFK